MYPQRLKWGDLEVDAWICGVCRSTFGSTGNGLEFASRCCKPRVCLATGCGRELAKNSGYSICDSCRENHRWQQILAAVAKAEKHSQDEYGGPVFDQHGEYYRSVGDYLEKHDGNVVADFVFGSKLRPLKFDVGIIVEHALDGHHDDASDRIPSSMIDELRSYLDGWAKRTGIVSYEEDRSVVVLLDSFTEEESCG